MLTWLESERPREKILDIAYCRLARPLAMRLPPLLHEPPEGIMPLAPRVTELRLARVGGRRPPGEARGAAAGQIDDSVRRVYDMAFAIMRAEATTSWQEALAIAERTGEALAVAEGEVSGEGAAMQETDREEAVGAEEDAE